MTGFLQELWDNGVAGFAAVGLVLSVWLGARTLGLLDRPAHRLESWYLRPRDLLGFSAMPHFMLECVNLGNVRVTFSDFELLLPRLKDVIDDDGRFVFQPGADFFIDKRPTSRIGGQQMYSMIDYRTTKIRLEPGDLHTEFFDLGALLPDYDTEKVMNTSAIPEDFSPVLAFRDSYGNQYHCDAEGVQVGMYRYPHAAALEEAGAGSQPDVAVFTHRGRFRRTTWVYDRETFVRR